MSPSTNIWNTNNSFSYFLNSFLSVDPGYESMERDLGLKWQSKPTTISCIVFYFIFRYYIEFLDSSYLSEVIFSKISSQFYFVCTFPLPSSPFRNLCVVFFCKSHNFFSLSTLSCVSWREKMTSRWRGIFLFPGVHIYFQVPLDPSIPRLFHVQCVRPKFYKKYFGIVNV